MDDKLVASATLKNKKEAKKQCAENALKIIFEDALPETAPDTLYDVIAQKANQKYDELTRLLPEYMTTEKSIAAFILKTSMYLSRVNNAFV